MKTEVLSPISGQPATFLFSETVLGKHTANYYLDETTSFIFVHNPAWLKEAYQNAIALTDTGILSRNLRNVDHCDRILRKIPSYDKLCGVDIGGGYGVFVRGIRDRGHDFYWHDKYALNLLAEGFGALERRYDVAVAFEVLEHVENPLFFLSEQKRTFGFNRLIFSATCFSTGEVPDRSWWYWAFESGQHISFFSRESLNFIAGKLNMRVRHLSEDLFIMEEDEIANSDITDKRNVLELASEALMAINRRLFNKTSPLTWTDHLMMKDKIK